MADDRLRQIYENIIRGTEVRESLIFLKEGIKEESLRRRFMYLLGGDFSVLVRLLSDQDPKVRKNAALILGQTEDEDVLPDLVRAWEGEQTLFVRQAYLKAMEELDYEPILPALRRRLAEIEAAAGGGRPEKEDAGPVHAGDDHLWDNGKHLAEEGRILRRMLDRYQKRARHSFSRWNPAPDLVLICNRSQIPATADQIRQGEKKLLKSGISVRGGDLRELLTVRTWSECLFPIPGIRPLPADEREAARELYERNFYGYLKALHGGAEGPYRYRIELRGSGRLQERKGTFIRALAARLDLLEKGRVQNDDSCYEAELRLIERADGKLAPMIKLYTLGDGRFSYRKAVTAQSMSPVLAALTIRLAGPFLKEEAQVLDPFCGTGTLLVERQIFGACRSCYGVDLYGDAILKARKNSEGFPRTHYINRNFFDFTHEYLFDELITELPDAQDSAFEDHFLAKAASLLQKGAVLSVVTRRPDALRGAIARQGYGAPKTYLLSERLGTSLLVFSYGRGGV